MSTGSTARQSAHLFSQNGCARWSKVSNEVRQTRDKVNEIAVDAIMLILTAKSQPNALEIGGNVPLCVLIIVKLGITGEAVIKHEIYLIEHIEIAPINLSLITDIVILFCIWCC